MLYIERARDLVRLWLTTRDKPENFVYAVGFLYRHAIELELKATIAWSDWFRSLTPREQRTTLWGHGLKELWKTAKPLVEHLVTEDEIEPFEVQLLELDRLDERSDGFRYPFRFVDREGHRQSLLGGLSFKSFDNFVWILEGLSAWVKSLQDEEERHREYEAELARDAGW
jgi:hypothetical protein